MSYRLVESMQLAAIDPNVNFLESVLESSTAFALIGEDLEGKTRLWNAGARQLFGLTAEMALGKPTAPILHGPEAGALARHSRIRESALAEGRWEGLIVGDCRTAGGRGLSLVVMPWQSPAKAPLGWIILATRASSQAVGYRGVVDAGHEADGFFRVLSGMLEVSHDATVVVDDRGLIFWLNREAEALFGCGRETLMGQPVGRILPDWDAARSLVEPSGTSSEPRQRVPIRWTGQRFDESPIALDMTVGTIEFGGRIWVSYVIEDAQQKTKSQGLVDRLSQRLEIMKRLDQASVASHHPRRLALTSLDHLQRVIPCWGMVLWIFDFATRTTEVMATVGERETPRPTGSVLPLDLFGLADIAELYAERDVNVKDAQEAANLSPVISELTGLGLRSVVRIPLSVDTRLIGALEIQFDEPARLDPDQLEIAHEVAEQLAIAIRHAILFQEVRSSRERLRTLSRQLLKTQEEERRHLARELHDEIGQSLTAVRINLQQAIGSSDVDSGGGLLKECDALVHHILQQVRDLSLDLRPSVLDDLGLVASIRWYLDRMARRAGFKGHFSADPPEIRAIADIETTCFRVAQEAVTNILRHAKAREVEIHLNRIGARLELTIRDDGVGFDVAGARKRALQGESLGIIGMQERVELVGGRISIDSVSGRGSEIRARIPLEMLPRPTEQGSGWEV